MGPFDFDFRPVIAFIFLVGGAIGAVGFALFVFVPLPWSFYGGLGAGLVLAVAGFTFWSWLIS